jgi:hypothetical protein
VHQALRRTRLTGRRQPSKLAIGVRLPGTAHAPLAQWQSNGLLIRRFGVQVPGGARGSDGNRKTSRAQTSRLARSNRAFRTRCLFVQLAGRRILVPEIVWVRIPERQRRRRVRLRLRSRTADDPARHRAAAHLRSYRNWQTGTVEGRAAAGSNPAERTPPGYASGTMHAFVALAVRAPLRYSGGPEFESRRRLHAVVAQQVRAPARQAGDRRFEAGQPLSCRPSPTVETPPSSRG